MNVIESTISFAQRKHYQSEITAGQLVNVNNVRRVITDDQIYASFKSVRGTPQYWNNMMLDVLAKIRHFGVATWFLTWSAAIFKWTETIKIVAYQTGERLTDDQINAMDWDTKVKYLKRNPVTVARQVDHIFRKVFKDILYSGLHPIGQILNHDDRREFQQRSGVEHAHVLVHVKNAPRIDENSDKEVIEFIDKHNTCELPDNVEYPELYDLVTSVQTHHHTTTCRKKKGVRCRFDAPWPPCEKTHIIRGQNADKSLWKKSRKILDNVLQEMSTVSDLESVSLTDILTSSGVTYDEYIEALEYSKHKLSIAYKRRPVEQNISPYNPLLLNSLKSNMNLQFVTGIYGLLAYLTSYMCKPERNMSELMKKALKEASGKDIKEKLRTVGNIFKTKRECSLSEAIKRTLSLPMRTSNIDVVHIPTGVRENRTRMLKSPEEIEIMDPDDTNVYKTNMLENYANRPDCLENMCYADFATNYISNSAIEPHTESEDAQTYTIPVHATDYGSEVMSKTISLKNKMGR